MKSCTFHVRNKQAHILYWSSKINQQFLLNLHTPARLEVFIAVKLRIVVYCNTGKGLVV
jgi:hypothetical protein